MDAGQALSLITRAVEIALMLAMPLLLTALLVGVTISLLQSITQIQEQTLTFVPKLLAVMFMFLLVFPWALEVVGQFLTELYLDFGQYIG